MGLFLQLIIILVTKGFHIMCGSQSPVMDYIWKMKYGIKSYKPPDKYRLISIFKNKFLYNIKNYITYILWKTWRQTWLFCNTCASKPKFEVCIHESYITLIKMDPNSDLKLDIYFLRLSKACMLIKLKQSLLA